MSVTVSKWISCSTPPSNAVALSVNRNGNSIGSINFASGQTTGTASVTETNFIVGDTLTIEAPASVDSAIQDVAITFTAQRTL